MAEHEWKTGDPAWWLPDYEEEWKAVIVETLPRLTNACVVVADSGGTFWAWYAELRPRDPALDGEDKPAESEAER